MAPSGLPLPWPGTLATTTIANGQTVLGAIVLTGAGFKTARVYTYSADQAGGSACTAACAISWPPLLTGGSPGVASSLKPTLLSSIKRSHGTSQVTYAGKPLYLCSMETPVQKAGATVIEGNGNGVTVAGGMFQLVTP